MIRKLVLEHEERNSVVHTKLMLNYIVQCSKQHIDEKSVLTQKIKQLKEENLEHQVQLYIILLPKVFNRVFFQVQHNKEKSDLMQKIKQLEDNQVKV